MVGVNKATRRHGREWALQMLFQSDMNPGIDLHITIPKFWRQQYTCRVEDAERRDEELPHSDKSIEDRVAPPKIRQYTETLVCGVMAHIDDLDARLESYTENWALHRMGSIERNVLRLALYELLYCPDVPPAVVLNEAIDLAKYFSNAEAGRFVNGVLDRFNKELNSSRKG